MGNVYAPDWYYELDCEREYECKDCLEYEQRLELAREALELLMNRMYSKSDWDEGMFESDLDNLCYALQINIRHDKLQIKGKNNE